MSDSLERLYQAVLAAKDLDPATSRTARLFQRGPSKMAKNLAEEAIEVVIDAVNGKSDAVVRESADLLYNLTVLWASAGVKPEDVWREMERREDMLGIAEKLPKSTLKMPKTLSDKTLSDKALSDKALSDKALSDKAMAGKTVANKALPGNVTKELTKSAASPAVRRRIVALEGRSIRKRH